MRARRQAKTLFIAAITHFAQEAANIEAALSAAKGSALTTDLRLTFGVTHSCLGHLWHAFGSLSRALASHRQALPIHEALAKQDSGNTESQHELSRCHTGIGNVLVALGDRTEALAA